MGYTAPVTVYTGDTWTAGNHNTYFKDNIIYLEAQAEGEYTAFLTAGGLVAQAGADPGLLERIDFGTLCHYGIPFDKDSDEFVNFLLGMPKRYDSGSVYVKYVWCTNGGTATGGNVVWSTAINGLDDGDSLGANPSAGVSNVTDAWSADDKIMKTSWDEVTVQGSPSDDNDVLEIQIGRDADNGSDTLDADAYLLGFWLRWTADAETDD